MLTAIVNVLNYYAAYPRHNRYFKLQKLDIHSYELQYYGKIAVLAIYKYYKQFPCISYTVISKQIMYAITRCTVYSGICETKKGYKAVTFLALPLFMKQH